MSDSTMPTQTEWEERFDEQPEYLSDLSAAIEKLCEGPGAGHDYNTSGISMSIAAQLAFNYVARRLGATGFQASYAALHAYGKIMSLRGPFGIMQANDLLYPQYDLHEQLDGWIQEWKPWLQEEAQRLLEEHDASTRDISFAVLEHWRALADG